MWEFSSRLGPRKGKVGKEYLTTLPGRHIVRIHLVLSVQQLQKVKHFARVKCH